MIVPANQNAIDLWHRGSLALSKVESNGILVDEKYLDKAIRRTERKIQKMRSDLYEHDVYKLWKRRFGSKASLTAPEQLAKVVFEDLGYKPIKGHTDTKKYKANEDAFEHVNEPFVRDLFEMKRLQKALTVNLMGLKNEIVDSYVHAIYNLNIAASYRSTCDTPNVQNQPVRNEDIGNLIRSCFIAPPGYRIGEIDYGKIEVCGAAIVTKDPILTREVVDPKADMHRDTAMQMFFLNKTDAALKPIRQVSKNAFVFPQFYGSYYVQCAKNVWDDIARYNLQTTSGVPLRKHLRKHGITDRGLCEKGTKDNKAPEPKSNTFEYHLRQVEKSFWKERFKVYDQWKRDWWQKYLERGWFRLKTGFVCQGFLDRKQVCNYPIQGIAFHMLLWSLVELQDWLEKNNCKTKILGQIHDSMLIQFHRKEIDDVLHQAKHIMTVKIRKAWPWISVPLKVEAEIAGKGESWAKKKGVLIS